MKTRNASNPAHCLMRPLRFVLAGTVAAGCMIGMAGLANAENLSSAWSKAYQSNPAIAAERARVRHRVGRVVRRGACPCLCLRVR